MKNLFYKLFSTRTLCNVMVLVRITGQLAILEREDVTNKAKNDVTGVKFT